MKIYIAGAITNNPNYREQFKAAEERLVAAGHAVINPCKNDGFTYREYINMGLCELMHCDAIYLLKGYENSSGATLEHDYARTVGLTIMHEEKPHRLVNFIQSLLKGKTNEEILESLVCDGCLYYAHCNKDERLKNCHSYSTAYALLTEHRSLTCDHTGGVNNG